MIERVSIWGEMTQKIYRLILEAYEQGIKEYTSKDVLEWWEAKYGEITDINTERKIINRVHSTGGLTYTKYYDKNFNSYSLVEENIDLLRYQLSLKSSEHKTQNLGPTKAELRAKHTAATVAKYELPENIAILNRLKTLSYDELMNIKVVDLPFCTRLKNCLIYDELYTVRDIIEKEDKHRLRYTPNFGPKCLIELIYVLEKLGLKLNDY